MFCSKKHQNAYTIHLSIYSYTHLSIYLSMSRWKEKYFLLTPDYLQCFKKGTSRISEMGSFDYKVIKCKHTQIHTHNHTHLYLMTQFVHRSVVWSVSRLAGSNCHNFQKGQEVSLPCSYRSTRCLYYSLPLSFSCFPLTQPFLISIIDLFLIFHFRHLLALILIPIIQVRLTDIEKIDLEDRYAL